MNENELGRYQRQMMYAKIGEAGQRKLQNSRVLLCGCGALGSVIANTLVRAGVGFLRIADRDILELNNLQRQVLYDEEDVQLGLPKAIAASEKLKKINSQVEIEPVVTDIDFSNIQSLCDGVDLILDGTDNFETRFLINDASIKFKIPWVYGGCLGADGQVMTILPEASPCLHCLMIDGPPPPGTSPTCDTAGILSPIINVIASMQANEALKILSGNVADVSKTLNVFELWENRIRQVKLDKLRESVNCPCCKQHKFPWLEGERGTHSTILCGRNSVQLSATDSVSLSLPEVAQKLASVGEIQLSTFMLRCKLPHHVISIFPDGRAIVSGTEDIAEAKSLFAKYVGV